MANVILNLSTLSGVADPYLSVKELVDLAHHKIEDDAEQAITPDVALKLLKYVLNEYSVNSSWKRTSLTFETVVDQTEYTIDSSDLQKIVSISYEDITPTRMEFLSENQFNQIDTAKYRGNPVYTILPVDPYYFTLKLLPSPDEIKTVTVTYYAAQVQDISSVDIYVPFPNQFSYCLLNSLMFKFIDFLPPNNKFKQEEKKYWSMHMEGIKEFTSWIQNKKTKNVTEILYLQNLLDTDMVRD